MKFKIKYLSFVPFFFYNLTFAQSKDEINFPFNSKFIQRGNSLLRNNKLYILDFWATWCAPCISKMPKFLTLAKSKENYSFSIVSNESQAKVLAFFKKRPELLNKNINVLEDQENLLFKRFGIESLPTTIVLDSNGRVLLTTQADLTIETLKALENGKRNDSFINNISKKDVSNTNPLFLFEISESNSVESTAAVKLDKDKGVLSYIGKSNTLEELYAISNKMSKLLVFDDSKFKDKRYDLKYINKRSIDDFDWFLSHYFLLTKEFKVEKIKSYKLSISDLKLYMKHRSQAGDKSSNSDLLDNKIEVINYDLKMVGNLLESYLNHPVVCDNNSIPVDLIIKFPADFNKLNKYLKNLGLNIELMDIDFKTLHLKNIR